MRDDLYGDSDDDMEIDDDEDYEADPDLLAELNAVNKNAPAAKKYTVEELKLQLKAKQREAVQAKRAGDTTRAVSLMKEAKELKKGMEAMAALRTSGPAPASPRVPSETKTEERTPTEPLTIEEQVGSLLEQIKLKQVLAIKTKKGGDRATTITLLKEIKTLKIEADVLMQAMEAKNNAAKEKRMKKFRLLESSLKKQVASTSNKARKKAYELQLTVSKFLSRVAPSLNRVWHRLLCCICTYVSSNLCMQWRIRIKAPLLTKLKWSKRMSG